VSSPTVWSFVTVDVVVGVVIGVVVTDGVLAGVHRAFVRLWYPHSPEPFIFLTGKKALGFPAFISTMILPSSSAVTFSQLRTSTASVPGANAPGTERLYRPPLAPRLEKTDTIWEPSAPFRVA